MLPLQNFEPAVRAKAAAEEFPREKRGEGKGAYPTDGQGRERRIGLHIPGDLSTNRPGHFKRLDSEARVGGGHGAEEVEDRI